MCYRTGPLFITVVFQLAESTCVNKDYYYFTLLSYSHKVNADC